MNVARECWPITTTLGEPKVLYIIYRDAMFGSFGDDRERRIPVACFSVHDMLENVPV